MPRYDTEVYRDFLEHRKICESCRTGFDVSAILIDRDKLCYVGKGLWNEFIAAPSPPRKMENW